jgi:hypothetical protein
MVATKGRYARMMFMYGNSIYKTSKEQYKKMQVMLL